jgi:hypothetical protein
VFTSGGNKYLRREKAGERTGENKIIPPELFFLPFLNNYSYYINIYFLLPLARLWFVAPLNDIIDGLLVNI